MCVFFGVEVIYQVCVWYVVQQQLVNDVLLELVCGQVDQWYYFGGVDDDVGEQWQYYCLQEWFVVGLG